MSVKKKPMTPDEFSEACDWSGGLVYAMFDGINNEDDLNNEDPELKEAWNTLCEVWPDFLFRVEEVLKCLYGVNP